MFDSKAVTGERELDTTDQRVMIVLKGAVVALIYDFLAESQLQMSFTAICKPWPEPSS